VVYPAIYGVKPLTGKTLGTGGFQGRWLR
jgi:hypothetical protein